MHDTCLLPAKHALTGVVLFTLICFIATPSMALAATSATGSIDAIAGISHDSTQDQMNLHDGSTNFMFAFVNAGGSQNGYCVNTSTYQYSGQPCAGNIPTAIDVGGGPSTSTMAQRITDAVNTTSIGITAAKSGNTVNLTNDSTGSAGNQTIWENVLYSAFVVSGMSGGTDDVPEFSDIMYLSTLLMAAGFMYIRFRKPHRIQA